MIQVISATNPIILDDLDGFFSGAKHSLCVLLLLDEPLHLFMLLLGVKQCLGFDVLWTDLKFGLI